MNYQIFKNISSKMAWHKADWSRWANISRAAVTKWAQKGDAQGWVNVETKTLLRLAEAAHVPPDRFLEKRESLAPYKTMFLWDALYPNMESFLKAISEARAPALARLVQVLGFYEAAKVAGRVVLSRFERYKSFIKPARRRQLETLWPLYFSRT